MQPARKTIFPHPGSGAQRTLERLAPFKALGADQSELNLTINFPLGDSPRGAARVGFAGNFDGIVTEMPRRRVHAAPDSCHKVGVLELR